MILAPSTQQLIDQKKPKTKPIIQMPAKDQVEQEQPKKLSTTKVRISYADKTHDVMICNGFCKSSFLYDLFQIKKHEERILGFIADKSLGPDVIIPWDCQHLREFGTTFTLKTIKIPPPTLYFDTITVPEKVDVFFAQTQPRKIHFFSTTVDGNALSTHFVYEV